MSCAPQSMALVENKTTLLLNEGVDPVLAQASHEREVLHAGHDARLEHGTMPLPSLVDSQGSQPMVLGAMT